ncbi:MAG: hypothetical protein ACRDRJ_15840 [Streptosporangiaceae bacterium]
MNTNSGFVDESGDVVLKFVSAARNLSRLGELSDEVVSIAKSGAWRKYRTAVGQDEWRECELDYFLIACDLPYDDVSRVLSYTRDGVTLAQMMDRDAEAGQRRSLTDAASGWHSPVPETLIQRAQRLGWTRNATTDSLRAAPVSRRARVRQASGVTRDEQARRGRTERLSAARRRELDMAVKDLRTVLKDETERLYAIDRLREKA